MNNAKGGIKIKATEKQIKLINKIINFFGYEIIENYIKCKLDLNNLTKADAQKIIIKYYSKLPKTHIKNVFGRDFNNFN